jgi:hypothetical protein
VLFDREKQLLPQSQYMVANFKEAEKLRVQLNNMNTELDELRMKTEALRQEIWRDTRKLDRLEYDNYKGGERQTKERSIYTFRCPVGECRGFVSVNEKKCGTCNTQICCTCGEEEGEGHVCDEDVKLSFKEIKKSTKPCPSCKTLITRSEGCSQMWCTICHCAFDYHTGERVTGVLHNPHYFAFLREHSSTGEIPRQPGDGDCGIPVPNAYILSSKIRRNQEICTDSSMFQMNAMYQFARKLLHIYDRTIPSIQRKGERSRDTSDLHLKYLLNEIDEIELKVQLQRREKKVNKDNMSLDIYQMCVTVGGELLWEFVNSEYDQKRIQDIHDRIQKLRAYTNQHLHVVCQRYDMTVCEFV